MRILVSILCFFALVQSCGAQQQRTVLVIHGGVGVETEAEMKAAGVTKADYEKKLALALEAGYAAMQKKKNNLDAVEAAIRVLEDSELFNAGKGAVFTSDGKVELDAAIMEGTMTGKGEGKKDPRKRAGAVSGLTHVKNPIAAARAVLEMENSRHCFLVGEGAEAFVLRDDNRAKYGIERVSNMYFWTDNQLQKTKKKLAEANQHKGTVGAVACDEQGRIVAGTSTGGVTAKWPGRVGDAPLIGSGTYADDRACGISCTGTGEVFIRHAVAHDIVARMVYAKNNVADAVKQTLDDLPDETGGVGGLIALDKDGKHSFGMTSNCNGMARGYVTADGKIYVAMYKNDEWKEMKR